MTGSQELDLQLAEALDEISDTATACADDEYDTTPSQSLNGSQSDSGYSADAGSYTPARLRSPEVDDCHSQYFASQAGTPLFYYSQHTESQQSDSVSGLMHVYESALNIFV